MGYNSLRTKDLLQKVKNRKIWTFSMLLPCRHESPTAKILIITKKFRNLDLIQLHLKLQKNLESKKVTEEGEYYFAKGFKMFHV